MNENNPHKNRKIIRLQTWDYRWAGSYFITICTQNRTNYFGEILHGKMQLSHVGVIANILWYEIKNRSKNVELGEFVVMPNHIHGILILNDAVGTGHALSAIEQTGNDIVMPGYALSAIEQTGNDFVMPGHALSAIEQTGLALSGDNDIKRLGHALALQQNENHIMGQ